MSVDEHGIRALETAEAAEGLADRVRNRDMLALATAGVIRELTGEIRWLVESRARWMAACQVRQITIHEEVHR